MTPPVERPSTPPRVREKLVEGELAYTRLAGQVGIMSERMDAMGERLDMLAEGQRELRSDLKEHERNNAKRDGEMRGEVAGMRKDLDARLDSIERTLTFCAGKEAGGGAGATLPTLPAALSPITSGGQARRAAAVGGGGLTLASLLGLLASLATLPLAVQWALGGVAVLAGVGAVAVAVRWGWRAAGR
jgi:hypothetical protein